METAIENGVPRDVEEILDGVGIRTGSRNNARPGGVDIEYMTNERWPQGLLSNSVLCILNILWALPGQFDFTTLMEHQGHGTSISENSNQTPNGAS